MLSKILAALASLFKVGPVARLILEARSAMNHGGTHWIQGDFCDILRDVERDTDGNGYGLSLREQLQKDPRKCGFCAIGALRFAAFGHYDDDTYHPNHPLFADGVVALVRSPSVAAYWADVKDEQLSYERAASYGPSRYYEAENYVIAWNDDRSATTWADVNDGFYLAAAKATGSPFVALALRAKVYTGRAMRAVKAAPSRLPSLTRA